MGRHAARWIFRVGQAILPSAQQLDPLLHIQNADAVPLQLGRLFGVSEKHLVDGIFLAFCKAAAGIADQDLQPVIRCFPCRDAHRTPIALVFQAVQEAVLHNGLQNEVGHLYAAQIGVDVVFALQLRVTVAHQLHVGLQQLQFVIQCHHLAVHLDTEPEEVHQTHEKVRHLFVSVQLGLDADGIQRVIQEMGVDLTFQVQHGHLLLRQLRPENIGIFQRQIEGQRHQSNAHAADEPGVVQPLHGADCDLNEQR